ncbi:Superoxide dismutase (Fe) [Sulfurovum sp. enrichment culture clone C5]|uniref:Superoxide dismutase n=1 Tax=Sulfurovum sp. enrichment culture clone C5 TaxID=497650 RepID=A0A0S4XNL9_9BACT|nr:Superoxide dismutase (Fe) [Sulfurovum sp. enrichment culture clone C5]
MSTIILPPLPFAYDSLEPFISTQTLTFHHDKHHASYVNNVNNLKKDTEFENKTLEEIIMTSKGGLFNNAAQVYNHTFYWNCLTPNETKPSDNLQNVIEKYFGSMDNFKKEFIASATSLFGSGWTWLVQKSDGSLEIFNTSNADTPMIHDLKPLMVCDVWEHAYYLDYQNARAKYVECFWSVINWEFVSQKFK